MNMNEIESMGVVNASPKVGVSGPDMFMQLGQITRQLHDTLTELGVMPNLQNAAAGLPDARSRLGYIATKTGEAAEKVLNLVDKAHSDRARIASATRALVAEALSAIATQTVKDIDGAGASIDTALLDIMVAQDFHDLTSQVVAKVLSLAGELEDSLVKLLVQAAPNHVQPETLALNGPVVAYEGRTDVVADQGEVDDLLASLGF
jgi:chemotaxis protein CheZ